MRLKDEFDAGLNRKEPDSAQLQVQQTRLMRAFQHNAARQAVVLSDMKTALARAPAIHSAMEENERSGGIGGLVANLLAMIFLEARDHAHDARLAMVERQGDRLRVRVRAQLIAHAARREQIAPQRAGP